MLATADLRQRIASVDAKYDEVLAELPLAIHSSVQVPRTPREMLRLSIDRLCHRG